MADFGGVASTPLCAPFWRWLVLAFFRFGECLTNWDGLLAISGCGWVASWGY